MTVTCKVSTRARLIASAALLLGAPALATPALALSVQQDETTRYSVAAGSMSDALANVARQAGLQLIANPADLSGLRSDGFDGDSTARTAIEAVIGGAPLTATFNGDTVIIRAGQAARQTAPAPLSQPQQPTETIIVQGFRSSFASSIETKRNADQVLDAITAEDIGQFPDQNIAEAVQRITGVQITRNNGEGESVAVRGLSPTFTRVEVNGRTTSVTIDSANPERQSVLSVFNSDLYNSIEVIKSPTAADVEGGVGGIVRLNTPRPLDIGERTFGFDLAYTDADLRDEAEPAVSVFYSDLTADERFGVLLAGTWEERDRRIDKVQSTNGWSELGDAAFAERHRFEQRQGTAPKLNMNLNLQFQPNDNLEVFADLLYTSEEREEDRSRLQIDWTRGKTDPTDLVVNDNGSIIAGTFAAPRVEFRSFTRQADIVTQGLTTGFNWDRNRWHVQGEISITESEEDFVEYRADARIDDKNGFGTYSLEDNVLYPVATAGPLTLELGDIDFRRIQLQRRIIGLEESDAELDVEYDLGAGSGMFTSIEFGARIASSEFDRRQGAIAGDTSGLTYADGLPFVIDGSYGHGQTPSGFVTEWPSVDPVPLYEDNPSNEPFSFNDENLWTITEDTVAVYGMANYTVENSALNMRGNVGVRVVETSFEGSGRVDIDTATEEILLDDDRTLDRSYTDILPSFNLLVSPTANTDLQFRFAISRALSRPTINEINPGLDINSEDFDGERGNPELDPFEAWQYDAGVEYYFGETGEGLISAALFYKDVENFIAPISINEDYDFGNGTAGTYEIDTFINGGEATIQGLEVGIQTPFSFLPGFWSNFGGLVNYTYTDSEFTDAFGNTFTFPGASEHAYNIVGYYEQGGFSTRLAYNFRDDFLLVQSSQGDGQNAEYTADQGRLDFAMRYRFENGLNLSFDALNLTEEVSYDYWDTTDRLSDYEFEGTIYTLSVGYRF